MGAYTFVVVFRRVRLNLRLITPYRVTFLHETNRAMGDRMKVMGVRVGPKHTRVAVVGRERGECTLLSTDAATRLTYPADLSSPDEKMFWLYREMARLHHEHPDLVKVCIKTNEYTQTDTKGKRESAYLEAAIMLYCRQQNIPVSVSVYGSLGTRRADVMCHAERRVGRTAMYWNQQMADAVVVAWNGART